MDKATLEKLKELGNRPRVHGNGFIQLDIDDRRRLHIWGHPEIPRQLTRSPIHDHIFSFKSRCLVGRLANVNYHQHIAPEGNWCVHVPQVRKDEDTILIPTQEKCFVVPASVEVIDARGPVQTYQMPAYTFHETFTDGPAATVIVKDGPTQAQGGAGLPRVLVNVEDKADNDFDRYDCADPETLWKIIEEVLFLG